MGIALACLLIGCSSPNATPASSPAPSATRTLYFAPLGGFPVDSAGSLVAFYHDKYGIAAKLLEAAALAPRAWDEQRHQLVGEEVIVSLKASYPQVAGDSGAIVIGLVPNDLYLRARTDWAWAFGLRSDGRFAVVSTARMSWPAGLAGDDLIAARLRKMVSKDVGLMYFGLPASDDPHSVLYRNIGGVDDLDRMGEDF